MKLNIDLDYKNIIFDSFEVKKLKQKLIQKLDLNYQNNIIFSILKLLKKAVKP